MLEIITIEENQSQLLQISGEIDASNSVELDEAMQKAFRSGHKHILVDGEKLEYISSAGLGVFMSYLEDFKEGNISFKIYGLNTRVFEVFKILGLDQLIPIYPDKTAATSA
ncbi:STAS domain-containing protein [Algoriphagus namhaensis]|uniref:Anti-sigma factor antagonist n=1 Tax=Algoriphagus namhaensis TaxID=915353 RepID=A0ABV8ALR4_9BACT